MSSFLQWCKPWQFYSLSRGLFFAARRIHPGLSVSISVKEKKTAKGRHILWGHIFLVFATPLHSKCPFFSVSMHFGKLSYFWYLFAAINCLKHCEAYVVSCVWQVPLNTSKNLMQFLMGFPLKCCKKGKALYRSYHPTSFFISSLCELV